MTFGFFLLLIFFILFLPFLSHSIPYGTCTPPLFFFSSVGDNDSRGLNHKRIDEKNLRRKKKMMMKKKEKVGHCVYARCCWEPTSDDMRSMKNIRFEWNARIGRTQCEIRPLLEEEHTSSLLYSFPFSFSLFQCACMQTMMYTRSVQLHSSR